MRIIAGKYGGRKLAAFKADHIRPTTDRVKEVIFNKLQFSIEGARVLDLFSGTGSLSFEALSRGADFVRAVEISRQSVQIINKNKKTLQIGDEMDIVSMDVLKFLEKSSGEPFDIILIDPPFTKKMASEVLQALSQSSFQNQGTEVFIESTAQESALDQYGSLILKKRQSYGDKHLSHYIFS
jgi:16S rRNA (guanine966-N2)-methyltransferase